VSGLADVILTFIRRGLNAPVRLMEMVMMGSLNELFRGCLLGSAAGDALAAPLVGAGKEAASGADGGPVTDFLDWKYPAGSVTAATQVMVAEAQGLLEMGRFEVGHSGLKLARLLQYSDSGEKEVRGVGLATAAASRKITIGLEVGESAVESGGCGPATRVAPIALRFFRDPKELRESAIEQAMVTHTGTEAVAGSVMIAHAIAHCVWTKDNEEDFDRLTMLEHLYKAVYEIDIELASKVSGLAEYLEKPTEEGFAYTGNSGWSMEAVPAALLAFLLSPGDLEKTVVTAANAGGCACAIAAMAGAVSGAWNGAGAVRSRWLDRLEGREYIELIADRLRVFILDRRPKSRPFW
jgi:ADP-ribosylglycohydrolase